MMTFDSHDLFLISALVLIVAALYSSVGHGGASGYLAILAFFAVPPQLMSSTALILNVLVSGIGLAMFWRAGYVQLQSLWPFAIGSVPAALIGGLLVVPHRFYSALLVVALTVAAIRLAFQFGASSTEILSTRKPGIAPAISIGVSVGLLSGIVGIGGGIFLGPILLLMKWAPPKETAGICAGFILVNSLAALAGRGMSGALQIGTLAPFLAVAFLGGLIGSYLGSRFFSPMLIRKVLAIVLLIAVLKLVIT